MSCPGIRPPATACQVPGPSAKAAFLIEHDTALPRASCGFQPPTYSHPGLNSPPAPSPQAPSSSNHALAGPFWQSDSMSPSSHYFRCKNFMCPQRPPPNSYFTNLTLSPGASPSLPLCSQLLHSGLSHFLHEYLLSEEMAVFQGSFQTRGGNTHSVSPSLQAASPTGGRTRHNTQEGVQ